MKKLPEYEYEYYSVWENHPNTNTNNIRFQKVTRIRIRILVFGLKYSNNIRIPNYSLTSDKQSYKQPKLIIFMKQVLHQVSNTITTTKHRKLWSSSVSRKKRSLHPQVVYSNQKPAYYLNRQFKIICSELSDRFTSNEYVQTVRDILFLHRCLPQFDTN